MTDFLEIWFPFMFALSMGFWAAHTMFTLHFLNKKVNKLIKDIDMISLELQSKDAKQFRKDLLNDIPKSNLPHWFTQPL